MKTNLGHYQGIITFILFVSTSISLDSCSKKTSGTNVTPPMVTASDQWITTASQSKLLEKGSSLAFSNYTNNYSFIDVDSVQTYQTIDGFGYTLTGGSASLINQLNSTDKANLLQELFGTGTNSIGVSYLRISIGASDLNSAVFSYDDMPAGQTDTALNHFSLANDTVDVIPLLKQIIAINPSIKILGSPWSPPVWMKDNGSTIGGNLQTQYYNVYAKYFVKYIQEMKQNGINIDAVTIQNEPMNPANNPSMQMTAGQEATFIKNNLGPAFNSASVTTKIIIWDHNCDNPGYPLSILGDADAKKYITGSAFHLYAGDIGALSTVHEAYPDKDVYFTEQWTGANGKFDGDLQWHLKNVVIGSMRNWSKTALEWNLANDPFYSLHTTGGCTECKGALTIGVTVTRNVGYYIIAHASKFVPAGSARIFSTAVSGFSNVAFLTPAGKKVLIAEYDGPGNFTFNIRFKGNWFTTTLAAGTVATYVW